MRVGAVIYVRDGYAPDFNPERAAAWVGKGDLCGLEPRAYSYVSKNIRESFFIGVYWGKGYKTRVRSRARCLTVFAIEKRFLNKHDIKLSFPCGSERCIMVSLRLTYVGLKDSKFPSHG